jgi:hypothetical protein
VVHDDDRERSLPHRDLHDARDRQSVAGIVDQVTGIKLVFILYGGTDMEFPAVKIMLAQSLKSVRKDQFFDRWRWRGRECDGRNRGRGQRFIDVRRSGCWRQGRRGWLTRGDENNKKKRSSPLDKQACALFHIPIVSRRINRSENSPAEESSGLARVQMIYLVRDLPKL